MSLAPNQISNRTAIFTLRGVGYKYLGRFPALRDISFDVYPGERLALLGANGSGKSTLLKMLDGLITPEEGTLEAFGTALSEEALGDGEFSRAFRRRVGFIFQNSEAQLFNPTVWDEVAYGPLHLGLSKEEARGRTQDVLEMLGLAEMGDRTPFNLSGGEKKKVAIACVLSINPDVLILDEPTNGLDPRTQHWLLELLLQLAESGKTIVIATHDLELVSQFASRCLVFGEDHRLAAEGTPHRILEDRALLLQVNLIHEHIHTHGELTHAHAHGTAEEHHGGH
ncbi:MAG: ABC transporter ATP-binding protein [Chloroflexota bacterium]|nr:MAG: ABC transporter ATP-binding protein [Chloroflexota bacterium]